MQNGAVPIAIRRGSWDDFDAVFAVSEASDRSLFGSSDFTPEHQRVSWERPSFVPERHLFVAEDDGAVIGHGTLAPGNDIWVRVHPDRLGEGVEAALIAAVEEQARGESLPFLATVIPDADVAACRAFGDAGYATERRVLRMEIELGAEPKPPRWPDGIAVRTYEDADGVAVHALLDEAYLGWDEAYVPVPHEDWLVWMTGHESFDPACWFLAEADGGLAGVVLNWKEGWVKDLAVRLEWRRRGVGEALLRHTFRKLYGRGVRRVGLKVDSDNTSGAPRLYERVGMAVDRRYPIFTKTL